MGVIVGVVVFLIALGAVISLVEKSAKGASSRVLRPYIGLLLIAGLIAGMGLVLGTMFRGVEEYFFIVAKGVAVFTGVILCLQLIIAIAKRFFVAD
jgi:phosphotransferase system  glucose/maltose/N-acetylglucosamine-specific IIC component